MVGFCKQHSVDFGSIHDETSAAATHLYQNAVHLAPFNERGKIHIMAYIEIQEIANRYLAVTRSLRCSYHQICEISAEIVTLITIMQG